MTVQQIPKNILGWLGFAVAAATLYAFLWQAGVESDKEFRDLMARDIHEISSKFNELTTILASVMEHVKAHDKKAEIHIEDIAWNRSKVIDLMTKPGARGDPFTGRQGDEMGERLRSIEMLVMTNKALIEKVSTKYEVLLDGEENTSARQPGGE